jgi:hypothetical protein
MSLSRLLILSPLCLGLAARADLPADANLYQTVLHPIMDAYCISCHGADKQKGRLRLDSKEAYAKGGKSGEPMLTPGKADKSEVFVRLALPHDHDDVMPPDDEKKLSQDEIALVKWWIEGAGASFEVKIGDAKLPDALKAVAAQAAKLKPVARQEKVPAPAGPVSVDDLLPKLKSLQDLGAIALPIAQNTRSLMVEFQLLGETVTDQQLDLLAPIADELEWLNLGRTKVTDAGLAKLTGLRKLRRLYLDRTGISDAGLAHLAALKDLEYLNLYGSKVGDGAVPHLKQLSGLKKLYLWQTGVTSNGVAALRTALPTTYIDDGWGAEDDAKAKASEKPAEPAPEAAKPKPEAQATVAVKFDPNSCCDKAEKAGKKCEHGCCVEAQKGGKVCAKCNPQAAKAPAAAPAPTVAVKFDPNSCCDKAEKAGKKCEHGCCVEAQTAGKVCAKCNPQAAKT